MLRVGIVGLGSWGRRLVDSVQGKSGKIAFSTAVTRHPDRIKAFCDKHGMGATADLSQMLGDKTIDAVVSAGPAGLHAKHALAAVEAGKHALVIKPFATNYAEAEALRIAAEKAGRLAVLGYNRCFMPPIVELRQRLAAGALGTLLHAEGNFCVDRYRDMKPGDWKTDRGQVLAGSLADHMLYGLIEFLGPVAEVHAHGATHVPSVPVTDTTAVLLRFRNGTSGLLTAIGVTAELYRLQVFGTKGWIELRGLSQFIFQPLEGKPEVIDYPPFDAERAELEAFAAAVADEAPFPFSVENAVHSAAVLQAMDQSARTGKPVAVAQ
jgi:predicted dehydrogenase